MRKKNNFSTVILIVILVAGLSLLLYPTVSDWWNSKVSSYAVTKYQQQLASIDEEQYNELWQAAADYNQSLAKRVNRFKLTSEQQMKYDSLLNIGGDGMMGYIEVPSQKIMLPIYHGTDEVTLQTAIGHLDWTSLPTGGVSTHCVLSGHRGLPSARLFTDLDKVRLGDVIVLHILDEVLTYEVDQILIVFPEEAEELMIQDGKDLLTLVTCTPYGVNTHRLLVRGHRTENLKQSIKIRVTADAVIIEKLIIAPFLLVPMLLMFLVFIAIPRKKKRRFDK